MSRRHLTLVVVAIASLVVSACSASSTGPQPTAPNRDAAADSIARIVTTGSSG